MVECRWNFPREREIYGRDPEVKFEYFREKLGVLQIEVPSKGK